MKKTFTFLMAALMLLTMMVLPEKVLATKFISYNGNSKDTETTISSSNCSSGTAGNISWTGVSCTYSNSRLNIAANGSLTYTAALGYVITKIVITSGSSSSYYGTWTSSPSVTPTSSSGVTTFDGLSASVVTVTTSTAFRCTSSSDIKIYYTAAPTTTDPTITFNNGNVRVGRTLNLSTLFTSNSAGAVTYSITAGGSYATLDGSTLTGVAEGSVTVKAAQAAAGDYNAGEATATITVNPALVLSSIAITTAPTKTTYTEGETFDPAGMVVTATYSNASTENVTALCTYSPTTALSTSDTEITVSYTENAVEKTATQTITVNPLPKYTVTYSDGGSVTEASYGAGVTLETRTGDATYTFIGWTTSNIASEITTAPTSVLTGTYHPTSDITLYPVYRRGVDGGTVWRKITDFSSVDAGTYALITPDGHAFNGTIDGGHGQVTSNAFSFTNNESNTAPTGTLELTLTAVLNNNQIVGYTMYNSTNKYLYASKASSGGLAWYDTESSYWKVSSSNWVYNYNSAYLRTYQNGSFRTYAGSSNSAFNFVKKVSNITYYYISTLSSIAVPSFDLTSQNFSTATLSVTITAGTGCVIKYTTDGTDPKESVTATTTDSNTKSVTVSTTTTIKAVAKQESTYSSVVSQTYTRVYEVTLSSNGVSGDPIEVTSGQTTTLTAPSSIPAGYSFRGWTATLESPSTSVSTTYIPTDNVTLYAVFGKNTYGDFKKVTSAPSDWTGYYLIVYEEDGVAFNGGINNSSYDVTSNIIDVEITTGGDSNKRIEANSTTTGAMFIVEKMVLHIH